MKEFFESVLLKVSRAEGQANALAKEVGEWLERNPLRADPVMREGNFGMKLVFRDFNEPMPLNDWGMLLGECAHNLRSALDNLAYALARLRKDPPENPRSIAFPIYSDIDEFKKSGIRTLSQLPQQAADLIEKLQPFQRDLPGGIGKTDEDLLLALHRLNNLDKHRVPAIVLLAPQDLKFNMSTEFICEADAAANLPPDTEVWPGPLSPGVVMVEYKTKHPLVRASMSVNGSAVVKLVGLQEPTPLIPFTNAIHTYVSLVVQRFSHFFEQEKS